MNADDALNHVDPEVWAATGPGKRLQLLEAVRENLAVMRGDLCAADTNMKNQRIGEEIYNDTISLGTTVLPIGGMINGILSVYESILHGRMPEPEKVIQVSDDLWDIYTRRLSAKERLMYAAQTEVLRVRGQPKQVNPYDKPAGIISVLGAGNYSSSLEMVNAMYLENCVVVHKPHHLNIETDRVWARIFQPLIEHKAIAFVEEDPGRLLTSDRRISKMYFTGGTSTAETIMAHTDIPLISECGGNNPVIIVPGDRLWTETEIAHQANQIVTTGKLNGGAVCGRGQTIVTSRHWSQRDQFLDALRKAIVQDTFAMGTYYPGSDKVKQGFLNAYPDAEILQPEGGAFKSAEFVLITGAEADGYAATHEAFCQILCEIPLEVAANAAEFLPTVSDYVNTNLLGTLGCAVLIDETTKEANQTALDQAVSDLNYGGIAVNEMPPAIWLSPFLTWGGNEEGKTFVSGIGNFGNALNYENVEKSILIGQFQSANHMLAQNKTAFGHLLSDMADFAVHPTWGTLTRLLGDAVIDSFRKKDF